MVHRSGHGPERPAARHTRPVPPSGSRLSPVTTWADPETKDLTPRRAHVTIRDIPRPLPITRRDVILHVAVAVLGVTLLVVIFWPR
jgi:hypothetical protein